MRRTGLTPGLDGSLALVRSVGLLDSRSMKSTSIVIPCFNEADRIRGDEFCSYLRSHPETRFIFVNDGSRDHTLSTLDHLVAQAPDQMQLIDQQPNRGKAEAVRTGMLAGFASGAEYVGYWDADLAAPLFEIERMQRLLDERPACEIVLGARVAMLGRRIKRGALRHYLGRVFAPSASLTLGLKVYDTQTGAKLFRTCDTTKALFAEPFLTSWIFDVEILARFVTQSAYIDPSHAVSPEQDRIVELPLREWVDRAGSKVKPIHFVLSFFEMTKLYRHYFGPRTQR